MSTATFSATKELLRTKHQNDDACYAVSANLIFPVNYHSDIPHVEKNVLWQRAADSLSMRYGVCNHEYKQ